MATTHTRLWINFDFVATYVMLALDEQTVRYVAIGMPIFEFEDVIATWCRQNAL